MVLLLCLIANSICLGMNLTYGNCGLAITSGIGMAASLIGLCCTM